MAGSGELRRIDDHHAKPSFFGDELRKALEDIGLHECRAGKPVQFAIPLGEVDGRGGGVDAVRAHCTGAKCMKAKSPRVTKGIENGPSVRQTSRRLSIGALVEIE